MRLLKLEKGFAPLILVFFGALLIIGLLFLAVIGRSILVTSPTALQDYAHGYRPFKITGHSMDPNFKDGQDWLSAPYISTQPQRGDAVIFINPQNQAQKFDKRIIGLPGDKVMVKGGLVYINDQRLEEPYLAPNTVTQAGNLPAEGQAVTIPSNNYYLLGDNRPFSSDSRNLGFIPRQSILYKLVYCYLNCH